MSGESTFGTSIAKLTSLPPVPRMSFASYQFLSENTTQYIGSFARSGFVPYCLSSSAARSSASGCLRNSSHAAGAPAGSGPADGAWSKSPLQVTERSPRMLSVSSAFSWPAFGMPTRMPNCCCTLGSEIVGSIRPSSNGRPAYSLIVREHARDRHRLRRKRERRAGADRAGRRGNRRAVRGHQRRAHAVVGLGALDVRLHHGLAGRLSGLDRVLHVRDRRFLDAELALRRRAARRERECREPGEPPTTGTRPWRRIIVIVIIGTSVTVLAVAVTAAAAWSSADGDAASPARTRRRT